MFFFVFIEISPRLSSLHSGSLVRIEESNDPYGIVSIEPLTVSVDEEPIKVNLNIQRTGRIILLYKSVCNTHFLGKIVSLNPASRCNLIKFCQ